VNEPDYNQMKNRKKILIVDDSATYRGLIRKALEGETDIQVIGSVNSGYEAIKFIRETPTDIITLDVEMPGLNGLETLEKIQEETLDNPSFANIGIIMVSAHTRKGADITIKALELGAFDFITKPETPSMNDNMDILRRQLLVKIRHYSISRSGRGTRGKESTVTQPAASTLSPTLSPAQEVLPSSRYKRSEPGLIRAILIGVSTGGPKALVRMLPSISEKVSLPVFIVQHMPPTFTQSLAETLNSKCSHRVIEVNKEEVVDNRTIYIAPGGKHLILMKSSRGDPSAIMTIINEEPPENGFRPSVDVLFRSASTVYGGDVLAMLLTGMGSDGTRGMGTLKRMGAYTIAQDEESSIVWGMPKSAIEAGYVDEILPLDLIPDSVERLLKRK
jgi:two-component system chemotaxis response regulator CheB